MTLYEMGSGKILLSKELAGSETTLKLSTESLTSGVYLIGFLRENQAPVFYKIVNIK